jgi:autotransporter strand-loop-strand O-heptosyltransferase
MTHLKMLTRCLGDTIAVAPLWDVYQKHTKEDCIVTTKHRELFEQIYPNLIFQDFATEVPNATKTLDLDSVWAFDRPLQLGFWEPFNLSIPYKEIRPTVKLSKASRVIQEKYVCIASHSSIQGKYWNNPQGWNVIVQNLKHLGYRVLSVDQYKVFGVEGHWNEIPSGSEDFTGKSLTDVIALLEHCEFFIGLTSGLSWLAHAVGKHVVMIAGITHQWCEFTIDITRINNEKVCHGCFNEPATTRFEHNNWMWCPKKINTPEEFICTKSIDPYIVWQRIIDAGILNENRSIDRGAPRQVFNFANKARKN